MSRARGDGLVAPCAGPDGSLPAECPGWCEYADPPRLVRLGRRPRPGRCLPAGYRLGDMLGSGGMGTVYAAEDPAGRPVAVKLLARALASDAAHRGRFTTEARAMQRVHHDNVVRIYDVGETEGVPFFAMQRVDGPDLHRLLGGPDIGLSRRDRLAIAEQICQAVAAIHATGIVHLDLKPANVLVERDGDTAPRALVTDFGLARPISSVCRLPAGELSGTPGFIAPEIATGTALRPEPSADVFAIGALVYQLLTDRPAFTASDTLALIAAPVETRPVAPSLACPGLDDDLDEILLAALSGDARARPALCEIVAALAESSSIAAM